MTFWQKLIRLPLVMVWPFAYPFMVLWDKMTGRRGYSFEQVIGVGVVILGLAIDLCVFAIVKGGYMWWKIIFHGH